MNNPAVPPNADDVAPLHVNEDATVPDPRPPTNAGRKVRAILNPVPRNEDDGNPNSVERNVSSSIWVPSVRVLKKWYVGMFRGAVEFVRYKLDVGMVGEFFKLPMDERNDPAMDKCYREAQDLIAVSAKKRMDCSLKRAEMYRVVAILARARAGGSLKDDFIAQTEMPVLRRSAGENGGGGRTKSIAYRLFPKYRWRGISIGYSDAVRDAAKKLKEMEARAIVKRKKGLDHSLKWKPLKIDDTDHEDLKNSAMDWRVKPLPEQTDAVDVDYELKKNNNKKAVEFAESVRILDTSELDGSSKKVVKALKDGRRAVVGHADEMSDNDDSDVTEDEEDEEGDVDMAVGSAGMPPSDD